MSVVQNIYVAGPMRGHEAFNFPAFFEAEKRLRGTYPGAFIFNPAREDVLRKGLLDMYADDPTGRLCGEYLQSNGTFTEEDLREALGQDLDFICERCDLLYLLPGWETSKGACAEEATARALGIEVCYPKETEVTFPKVGQREFVAGGEQRVVSVTGGAKGTKLAAFDQISPEVEWLVAEHFGKGARKYEAHNFRRGYPWSLSYSALRRHLAEFWMGHLYDVCPADGHGCQITHPTTGEDTREETPNGWTCYNHTGSLHIVAVIWHAMVLTEFLIHHKEYDDRYVYPHN